MVDVDGWVLQVNSRSYTLSEERMPEGTILDPDGFGVVIDLTLPNAGATLCLYDPHGPSGTCGKLYDSMEGS